jgi:RNA polymerase sigma factor (sigma-70 family)
VHDPLDTWFAREILPHEPALLTFLARIWPIRNEIPDLRQDIYVKAYEAAEAHYKEKGEAPTSARAILFTIARNLVIDRIRRGRVVSIHSVGDSSLLNVLVDEVSPERTLSAHQELKQLADAFTALPPKCRDIVWLRKVAGLPQSEVARRLGISIRTVEGQVQKGVARLARALLEQPEVSAHKPLKKREDEHGKH